MNLNDLGPLPRIHPREAAVSQAMSDIATAINDAIKRHGLTSAEALRAVNTAASDWIGGLARIAIRHERHGDTDKPGGVAP